MATSHLCKTDIGTGASATHPLVADDSHLFVIRHTNSWSSDAGKDLIVTPDEEYFSQAVAWGDQPSRYQYQCGENDEDARHMQSKLAEIRDAKTTASWHEGHRPMYAYWARSYPPYRIKADPDIDATKLMRTMELGSCWRLLRFNFFALPIGNLSKFSAWWRVWNPSCLNDREIPGGVQHNVYAIPGLYNGAGVMHYKFADEIKPPKFHTGNGHGEADIGAVSNMGHANLTNENSNCMPYDIYGSHNGVAAPAARNYYEKEHVRIFTPDPLGSFSSPSYYEDIQITGDGLASLKSALSSRGPVWAHCGFPIVDAQSTWVQPSSQQGLPGTTHYGQDPYETMFLYCSRLELRINVKWGKFNSN